MASPETKTQFVGIDTVSGLMETMAVKANPAVLQDTAKQTALAEAGRYYAERLATNVGEILHMPTDIVHREDVANAVEKHRQGHGVVTLNPDLYSGHPNDTRVKPVHMNRLTLLDFPVTYGAHETGDLKVAMTGNGQTLDAQFDDLTSVFAGEQVDLVDDMVESGMTLLKTKKRLQEKEIGVRRIVAAANASGSNQLKDGTPIETVSQHDPEVTLSLELSDVSPYGGSTPMRGAYEARQQLLSLHDLLGKVLTNRDISGSLDTKGLTHALKTLGVSVQDQEELERYLQSLSLDKVAAGMVSLLTPREVAIGGNTARIKPAALAIAGVDPTHASLSRRAYILPWGYRKDNPVGQIFTDHQRQQLGVASLYDSADVLDQMETIAGESIPANDVATLIYPGAQKELASFSHDGSAKEVFRGLARKINAEINGPAQYPGSDVPYQPSRRISPAGTVFAASGD